MIGIIIFIVILAIIIYGEIKWNILSTYYNKDRKSHKLTKIMVSLFCFTLAILFFVLLSDSTNPIDYPLNSIENSNPYVQQFDAFKKGQLHIDYEPDEDLLNLENPYDPEARKGIYYLWDRAFYEGKFYSYFGIAPIITVYYPYHFLTGNLPSDSLVVAIFLALTTLFFPLCIFEWAGYYLKRVPLSLLSVATIAATLGTNIFLTARGVSHFYYIAVLSGMAFLSMFLYFLFRSLLSKGKWRIILMILGGISYSLLFLSRVNMAFLAVFVVIPMVWFYIINRKDEIRTIKKIIIEMIALGAPVAISVLFTLWFNNARFSSPFDFGTNYQLTVSDISLNRLRLEDLSYAIYHYFLQGLSISPDYPYKTLSFNGFFNSGRYVYVDSNLGLLTTPLMFGLLVTPFVLFRQKRDLKLSVLLSSALVGVVFVAWLNFCMGGVIFRYTSDLTIIASLSSVIIVLLIFERLINDCPKWAFYVFSTGFASFFFISIMVSIRIALIANPNLSIIDQKVLDVIMKLLPFN